MTHKNIKKRMETEMIEGEFSIMKDGKMYVGKRKLKKDDVVHLPVKMLRQIIAEAKKGLI